MSILCDLINQTKNTCNKQNATLKIYLNNQTIFNLTKKMKQKFTKNNIGKIRKNNKKMPPLCFVQSKIVQCIFY